MGEDKKELEKKNTRVNERITRMREGMKVEVREGMNIGEMKGRMIIEVENVETSMLRIGRRTRGMIETTGGKRTIRKIQRTMVRKMKQKKSGGKLIRRKTLRGMINVTIGEKEKKNTRVNERITRMREGMKVEVREWMNIGEMKGRMIIEVENVET